LTDAGFQLIENQMGRDMLKALLALYLENMPQNLLSLEGALGKQDLEKLADVSHLVAGSLGVLGLNEGVEIAKATEQASYERDMARAIPLGKSLAGYLKESLVHAGAYSSTLGLP
jgi:HPt (histidine-containing phosphotransfer) domain-containing protein